MQAAEIEGIVSGFLAVARSADKTLACAIEGEERPNDATQDLLHMAELCPNMLAQKFPSSIDLIAALHYLREMRRVSKQEKEAVQVFASWTTENKRAIDKLDQVVGQMRKILKHQPNQMYRFKTDYIGEKDTYLDKEAEIGTMENAFDLVTDNQITIDEWMASQEA